MYYSNLDSYENIDKHKQVIFDFFGKDNTLINKAIEVVEKYHDTPRTLYSGNYNRHPIRVARILLEELDSNDTEIILTALCHDLLEWTDFKKDDIEGNFGKKVLDGVLKLTWEGNMDWNEFFQSIIKTGDKNLILIKMADKLDNNRSAFFSLDQNEKTKAIEKTEKILKPFVQSKFPEYWIKLEESLSVLR